MQIDSHSFTQLLNRELNQDIREARRKEALQKLKELSNKEGATAVSPVERAVMIAYLNNISSSLARFEERKFSGDLGMIFPFEDNDRIIEDATIPALYDNEEARAIKQEYKKLNSDIKRRLMDARHIAEKLGPGVHSLVNGEGKVVATVTVAEDKEGNVSVTIEKNDGSREIITYNKNINNDCRIERTSADGFRETLQRHGATLTRTANSVTNRYSIDDQGRVVKESAGPSSDDACKTVINRDGSTDRFMLVYFDENGNPVYEQTHRSQSSKYRNALKRELDRVEGFSQLPVDLQQRIISFICARPDKDIVEAVKTLIKDRRITSGVMAQLEHLADSQFELAEGIDREELIKQAILDIAYPQRISQGGKGTCAITSVQIALAVRNPERYLEILAALAGKSGDASSLVSTIVPDKKGGLTFIGLKREPGTERDDHSGRTITTRLMSPAFMEFANGLSEYYNDSDVNVTPDGGEYRGEWPDLILAGATRESVKRTTDFAEVERALNEGRIVLVCLRWGKDPKKEDGRHEVFLQHLDGNYAYFINPWGDLHKIPLEEFNERFVDASITEGRGGSAPAPAETRDWSKYREYHIG